MPNNFKICSAMPFKISHFLFGINQSFRKFKPIVPKNVLHNQQMWVIKHTRVISQLNIWMFVQKNHEENNTHHPISSNSRPSATANKAIHCLKWGEGVQNNTVLPIKRLSLTIMIREHRPYIGDIFAPVG